MVSINKFNKIASGMSKTFCEKYPKNEWSVSNTTEKIDLYKNKLYQCSFGREGTFSMGITNSLSHDQEKDVCDYRDIIVNDLSFDPDKKEQLDAKPSYYKDANGKDLFYHLENGLVNAEMYKGFLVGNIFKYITRHGKKDKSKTIEDLKKARDYLDELIKFESDDQ